MPSSAKPFLDRHARLHSALQARHDSQLSPDAFIKILADDGPALCAELPEKFRPVLDDISMRLESSRLFSADSCSFSDKELLKALQTWLDRAELRWREAQATHNTGR